MRYDKALMDELCDTARLYAGSGYLREKLMVVLDKHIPNLDEACKERGCMSYEPERKEELTNAVL